MAIIYNFIRIQITNGLVKIYLGIKIILRM